MFTIRKAVKDDCPTLRQLILELAAHENGNTDLVYPLEQLEEQGFCDQPSKQLFQALVAQSTDSKQQLVGYIIYYMTYSAFSGKIIRMEELYVNAEYRRCGLGRTLMRELAKEAIQLSVNSIEWDCMSNNESLLLFLKRLGGKDLTDSEGVHMYWLIGDQLKQLVDTSDSDGHQCLATCIREATKEDSRILHQLTQ
ncbi:diamine acetyltransferase 1-like [Oppia nitens]|uniref:diamine acetyltransferase 1-like n=1 Tax=Oppia nitens TaxID=1686743 RepID=UPI0023DB5388|nr:diamine acetyltransferase 1-like [Oppia nitens]